MIRLSLCVVALATAVAVASAALAGREAAKQRVAITAKGPANPTSCCTFVLEPLQAGVLKYDSGTETGSVASERVVIRDGQEVRIVNWISTFKGRRGTFVLRVRIEHLDAGNGFHIGTGTWAFVRGTGRYARLGGGGRVANAWVEGAALSERREGFLAAR
jgi:hypothetical protein